VSRDMRGDSAAQSTSGSLKEAIGLVLVDLTRLREATDPRGINASGHFGVLSLTANSSLRPTMSQPAPSTMTAFCRRGARRFVDTSHTAGLSAAQIVYRLIRAYVTLSPPSSHR
jgi:hypothetical protein